MKVLPLVVLISGRGSNLQALVEARDPLIDIRAVISNRPDAKGLAYAQAAGLTTEVLDHKLFASRDAFEKALQACLECYQPDLIVLAGFMRILTSHFVFRYRGRLLNIHPSLLPNFRGLHTHEQALAAGVQEHGASVHFVTEDLDAGPIIIQARGPILADDDADSLAARVLQEEPASFSTAEWITGAALVISSLLSFFYLAPIAVRGLLAPQEDAAPPEFVRPGGAPGLAVAPLVATAIACLVLFFFAGEIADFLAPVARAAQ